VRQDQKQLPLQAVQHTFQRNWHRKGCLHPSARAGRCGKVINAHTVQRSRILEQIKDEKNQVLTFYGCEMGGTDCVDPRPVGWQDASTFPGFCTIHDTVFSPVEREPFRATPEQVFLLGYRAICHELYQKRAALRSYPAVKPLIDRGRSISVQMEIQAQLAWYEDGFASGATWASASKQRMDQELLTGDYNDFASCVAYLSGPLTVTSSGVLTPTHDLRGGHIQDLSDTDVDLQQLMFSVARTESGPAAVFSWRRNHAAIGRFVESLLDYGVSTTPSVIVQMIFAYLENTFFSRLWWNELADSDKNIIAKHAMNLYPYDETVTYYRSTLIPWTLVAADRSYL